MDAVAYDAWYRTARGAWIGEIEFRTLERLLQAAPGESLLDVGCGTGYFTRRFASEAELRVVGLDPDACWLEFARAHATGREHHCLGTAHALPFADSSFDHSISVTALCFIADPKRAVREMLRVTRKRFAIGLLHRPSLLYLQKGRHGGSGAYHGARWHTAGEVRALFDSLPVAKLMVETAILFPGAGRFARSMEAFAAARWPFGAFIVAAGEVSGVAWRKPPSRKASLIAATQSGGDIHGAACDNFSALPPNGDRQSIGARELLLDQVLQLRQTEARQRSAIDEEFRGLGNV